MKRNSNEEDLKRERKSLRGKIKRRRDQILFARHEMREFLDRLDAVEAQLAEFKTPRNGSGGNET